MTWQDFFMLGGGLGLFLFGMKMMGDELERCWVTVRDICWRY